MTARPWQICDYRVHIQRSWMEEGHRLIVARDTRRPGKNCLVEIATGFTWNEHDEADAWVATDGIASADHLIQGIVDKAWEAGFRPRGFSDIKNETAALREHLADMKRVAFHQLRIK
jgi:hypothetical protein